MSRRPDPAPNARRPPARDDVAIGVVVEAITLSAGDAVDGATTAAPDWIKLFPRGRTPTRDGRFYVVDPERLVARFDADGVKLPIDFDHELVGAAFRGAKADAVGWIDKLEARADGLHGHVETWLAPALAALAAKTHRYLSPSFRHGEDLVPTWLHSVSLVASPALALPAIASALDPFATVRGETTMKEIEVALGLAAGAGEQACLGAIVSLKAGGVAKAIHDEALAKLAATTTELATLKTTLRQSEVNSVLEAALADKKIVPAQREHYAKLCATEDGLAGVKALLASTTPGLGAAGLGGRPVKGVGASDDPESILALASARVEKAAKGGRTLSLADAVAQVTETQTETV